MKRKMVMGLALVCFFSLSGIVAQAETTLKLGSVVPASSPWGKWIQAVVKKIEEESKGELVIDLLLDAQAGDEQTILRKTAKGRLDIAFVSNVPLTLLSQELAIPSAAYLFDNIDQGTCVAHKHLGATLDKIMQKAGVEPLGWWEVGNYIIFSREPIRTPHDLNGKKVRIAPSIADAVFAEQLHTSGIPMGTSDTIPALQTGTVDAAFFPTVFGIAIGTHKVAPNVLVTNHSRLIGATALSVRRAKKLTEQERNWLGKFKEMAPQLTEIILGAEKALLQQIKDAGIPVTYPSDDELASWRAAADGVLDELVKQASGNAIQVAKALSEAKQSCGSGS